jgi:hypothetical protein
VQNPLTDGFNLLGRLLAFQREQGLASFHEKAGLNQPTGENPLFH